MLSLNLARPEGAPLRLLCLGAHSDDIEIGCGGTLLRLLAAARPKAVTWAVLSGERVREREARASAAAILADVPQREIVVMPFRDGFFPAQVGAIKEWFEDLKARETPSLVFTHHRADQHQDHRLVAELTWQTFRDHAILEYEVPKYEGDLGAPNLFVPLDAALCERKVAHLLASFPSQQDRRWFSRDLFLAVLRLRGLESGAPSGYAEAFHARKLVLA